MQTTEILKSTLSHMFDFEDGYMFNGIEFQLYGKYSLRNSRFIGSKKVEIYAYSIFEHIFYQRVNSVLDCKKFDEIDSVLTEHIREIVEPNEEHMSSILTLIVECDSIEAELERKISKYKHKKSFKFGLEGWASIKVIVLVRDKKIVLENKLAKGDAEKLKLLSVFE